MIIDKLNLIKNEIQLKINVSRFCPKIIAVSKTYEMNNILPLIKYGHEDFGENKVQEALLKWKHIKVDYPNIKLHMIGKIQTNKVKYVVDLFDYVHSLDNISLAEKISIEQKKKKKYLKIFIQVNIGNEIQKSGVSLGKLNEFYSFCTQDLKLNIVGLMCLPPKDDNTKEYFIKMKNLAQRINIKELSMGMSNDYLDAAKHGATYLRIGSKIFGNRN
jgi:hypothetical protein